MTVAIDSSVWVDFLRGTPTPQALAARAMLGTEPVSVPDLVLMEVLQGCTSEASFRRARDLLSLADYLTVCDEEAIFEAARNYRKLRGLGVTVRKTIDTLIATRCILDGIPLLYSDRDFDPFVEHLGLISAFDSARGVT